MREAKVGIEIAWSLWCNLPAEYHKPKNELLILHKQDTIKMNCSIIS